MLAKKPKKGAVKKKKTSGASGLLWMFIGAILTLMIGLFLYLWNPIDMGTETVPETHTVQPIGQNNTTAQSDEYEFYELLPEQQITNIPDTAVVEDRVEDDESLVPDVVVTEPADDRANQDESAEYGISEDTIRNPTQSQEVQAASGEQPVEIVEEAGTYDGVDTAGTEAGIGADTPSSGSTNPTDSTNSGSNAQANKPQASINAALPKQTYILQINSYSTAEEADKRRAQVLMAGVDATVVKNRMSNEQVFYQVVSQPMVSRQAVISAQQKLQNNGIDSLIVEQNRQ